MNIRYPIYEGVYRILTVGGSYYTLGSYPAIAFRAFRVTSTAVSLSAITGR